MNNLAPPRKEENPLIGLMELGEKPGAGGPGAAAKCFGRQAPTLP